MKPPLQQRIDLWRIKNSAASSIPRYWQRMLEPWRRRLTALESGSSSVPSIDEIIHRLMDDPACSCAIE
jgi:hypothetical protein